MDDAAGSVKFEDEDELVVLVTHLKSSEKNELVGILNALKIDYMVSGHDAADRYSSLYYQIKVRAGDFRGAQQAVKQHKAKMFIESRKCPYCGHLGYREIAKRGLWEKILYAGTILVQCKKCKRKFGI